MFLAERWTTVRKVCFTVNELSLQVLPKNVCSSYCLSAVVSFIAYFLIEQILRKKKGGGGGDDDDDGGGERHRSRKRSRSRSRDRDR